MSQYGVGVLINSMYASDFNLDQVKGLKIVKAVLENKNNYEDFLLLELSNGKTLKLWDNGQSCCEHRYMTTDDDLQSFVGAKLVGIEVREGPSQPPGSEYGDDHEQQFLLINTDKGTITCVTHNEHNGYYGGFSLSAELV